MANLLILHRPLFGSDKLLNVAYSCRAIIIEAYYSWFTILPVIFGSSVTELFSLPLYIRTDIKRSELLNPNLRGLFNLQWDLVPSYTTVFTVTGQPHTHTRPSVFVFDENRVLGQSFIGMPASNRPMSRYSVAGVPRVGYLIGTGGVGVQIWLPANTIGVNHAWWLRTIVHNDVTTKGIAVIPDNN